MSIHRRHPQYGQHMFCRRACRSTRRRGVALFLLLVFLALAALFMTGWLTSAASERRAARLAQERLQTAWLAESGVERAAARVARDGDYQGETWRIPAEQLAGAYNGVIEIKIERPADAAETAGDVATVRVEAQLRDGDETVARARKEVAVRLSKSEESS